MTLNGRQLLNVVLSLIVQGIISGEFDFGSGFVSSGKLGLRKILSNLGKAAIAASWITGTAVANHLDDVHPKDRLGSLPPSGKQAGGNPGGQHTRNGAD
jgi:hypothetical protein